jgi:hypothetical protein
MIHPNAEKGGGPGRGKKASVTKGFSFERLSIAREVLRTRAYEGIAYT